MRNPFAIPLRNTTTPGAEPGHPAEGWDPPRAYELDSAYPNQYLMNDLMPYHDTVQEKFQDTNPGYAGRYDPAFVNARGMEPGFSQQAPAPGSESLRAPREHAAPAIRGESTGTNRLFKPHGPVNGANVTEFTGSNTALRKPVVGNSGPVSGGRDGAQIAHQAYFAAQAARYSQAASDAAMVAAL